ncbi:MAG: LacI family DNA-binding transcriptional regulator [Bacteroidales bacterium]|nr:LacI family DNA-binding transcriptional regulator [Bacteroidales bacterium]MDD3521337.1 LacI family DNA-binding transcriptional regulator [Bacteroidales bacterium]MDD4030599.1 LacI family DNA-binding transcriptional regulator [Bacteroidales bacterium]MDD4434712.1 LacI family DNA-binding transcriptional regulator [Bacteroidales bacterium]MDD5732176.1 LacI family DNA-binding transcriptional regulator [Bacteroidales bacterium]
MARRVTIKDVAKEAGVSIALVSMVLNSKISPEGKPDFHVRKTTAKRIFDAVAKLGYIPNNAAASIRSGRTYTIAVITSDISNSFFSEISKYIENLAYDQGYNIIFTSSDENPVKLSRVVDSALRLGIDGIIIVPSPNAEFALNRLYGLGIPIVFLERDIPQFPDAGRVLLDNAEADRLSVDVLYNSGYRKIEMIAYDMNISTIQMRIEGYKKEMTKRGLAENIHVNYIKHGSKVEQVEALIRNAVDRGVEALYLTTNTITILSMTAIKNLNLKVPRDMAFVGFDYSPVFEVYDTTVSYIRQSTKQLAYESFTMLVNMIENKAEACTVVLSPELVIGDSSMKNP